MTEHPAEHTGDAVHTGDPAPGNGESPVVDGLAARVPPGRITAVVGRIDACGRSALLRGMARSLSPASSAAYLDGALTHTLPTRQLAQRMGLLPQAPAAPEGITVADLVACGRTSYRSRSEAWNGEDDDAVAAAMRATGIREAAGRPVDELPGGVRRRAWIAMALAQRTGTLVIDEPTAFADMAEQVSMLDLLADLSRGEGTTIVAALHDLNLACRYADHLLVMKDGALAAHGPPAEVVTERRLREVFGLPFRVLADPVSATPVIVPVGRHHTAAADGTSAAADGSTGSADARDAARGEAVSVDGRSPEAGPVVGAARLRGAGGSTGSATGGHAAEGAGAAGVARHGAAGESAAAEGSHAAGIDGPPPAEAPVTSEAELRSVVEPPADVIRDKAVVGVDAQSRRFVAASPFFLLATTADDGTVDVSPRGDPPGSVLVLDGGRTLAFADRGGNRRVDSMRNILRSPRVGMLFVVPNVEHTLRVNGRARIVRDSGLLDRLARGRSRPELATVVEVEELFVHCGRAFTRSSLWDTATWPERDDLPTAGTLFKSQATLPKADTA